MKNEIINKYKNLGVHIQKTKSRQEIFTNISHTDSSLLTLEFATAFSNDVQKQEIKEY
ncbi:Lmo0850 family protein [Peribacillus sp. NPDC097206]|uniref:Lmo0850 family protein n=1 Tax=unclassified Peribacillus TaxID=2675266 RepID=UPI0038215558